MPIDVEKAVGAKLESYASSWDRDQVILYHLGIGCGNPPTDAAELKYCYEGRLVVLPSFGVIPAFLMLSRMGKVPGLQFNPAMVLHGEQDLTIHKAIPVEADVEHFGELEAIYDKGKGAVLVIRAETRDKAGELIFTNRFSVFIRGEGGFGGDPGPKPGNEVPDREPDGIVESPTLPQQALIYRLSGDKNPLHADPAFAKFGGFDQPILHGLCTYGVVCKAAVEKMLGGDPSKVAGYQVRFAGVVFPGETIISRFWREDGKLLIEATTAERGKPILSNAAILLRD